MEPQPTDNERNTGAESARAATRLSVPRKLCFALVPLLLLLLCGELLIRVYFYQTRSRYPIALYGAFCRIRYHVMTKLAHVKVSGLAIPAEAEVELFGPLGRDVLDEFESRYEEHFTALVRDVGSVHSRLIVVYIPSGEYRSKQEIMAATRQFYHTLCQRHKVDILDLTDEFMKHPTELVTLLPQNEHLSRFGNRVVAEAIACHIRAHLGDYRSAYRCADTDRSKRFGDLQPDNDRIWEYPATMPYFVDVNSQGLRLDYDITFPKTKQRIVILGDSFTFGPFLENHDTFPGMLRKLVPEREFVNAGVCGYTITDEASLFAARAKYLEPDITILQVLDNDLYGLFYFKQNEFDRQGRTFQPSEKQRAFLKALRGKLGPTAP